MNKIVLNPNCSELVMRFKGIQFSGMTKDELLRELDKIGIIEVERLENFFWSGNAIDNILVDKEDPNSPDFEYHSYIRVEEHFRGYRGEEDTLAILAIQHSQHQVFPTVNKIASHFRVEVLGFDGGNEDGFLEWLKTGKPEIPDYNGKHKERRDELLRKLTTEVPSGEKSKTGGE